MSSNRKSRIPFCDSLPSDWDEIPNRYIFYRHSRKVGDKSNCYQLLSLTTQGVKQKDINAAGGKVPKNYDNYQTVEKNDMIFCLFDLDCSAVFSGLSKYDGMITSAYNVFGVNNDYADNSYLNYWFQFVFSNRYYKMFSKSIRYTVTEDNFKMQYTPIPPIVEQVKIGEYLDGKIKKIDTLIANQQQQIEKLKQYKQSLITEVVTKGLDKDVPMKDSGVDWIGQIPESWKVTTLGAVSKQMRNGYVGPTRDLFFDEGVPYIQSLHIKDGDIDFKKHEYFVSETWAQKHPKVNVGNLLIVQTGDIGQVGVVRKEQDGYNCHALIIVDVNNELVSTDFLSYYFRSVCGKELLLATKTGALLPHLNSGKVGVTKIVFPEINQQNIIVEFLDQNCKIINGLIKIREEKISKLNQYKKSLIYEYVTGKKRVPEA